MAKKIISKASVTSASSHRDDSSGYYSSSGERSSGTNGKRATKPPGSGVRPLNRSSVHHSISENNIARLNQLHLLGENNSGQQQQVSMTPIQSVGTSSAYGGGVCGGSRRASSPDVTVLKTKVMYHSKSDFRTVQQQEQQQQGAEEGEEDHEQEAQV